MILGLADVYKTFAKQSKEISLFPVNNPTQYCAFVVPYEVARKNNGCVDPETFFKVCPINLTSYPLFIDKIIEYADINTEAAIFVHIFYHTYERRNTVLHCGFIISQDLTHLESFLLRSGTKKEVDKSRELMMALERLITIKFY